MDGLIIRCKCGHVEYDDHARWLTGGPWCRQCYKNRYHEIYQHPYKWTDIDDVPEPSEEMYRKQQESFRTGVQ